MSGPIVMGFMSPAADQLWPEVQGVIEAVNVWMWPFLEMFGMEDGNRLSQLITSEYSTVGDCHRVLEKFFERWAKDLRDSSSTATAVFQMMSPPKQ